MSFSVLGWDREQGYYPLRANEKPGEKVVLLLIGNQYTYHYVLVKDLSTLLYHRTKHARRMFYCNRCLHGYTTKKLHDQHMEDCRNFSLQKTEMPTEDMSFKAWNKTVPFSGQLTNI